jgi:hypothetical protein
VLNPSHYKIEVTNCDRKSVQPTLTIKTLVYWLNQTTYNLRGFSVYWSSGSSVHFFFYYCAILIPCNMKTLNSSIYIYVFPCPQTEKVTFKISLKRTGIIFLARIHVKYSVALRQNLLVGHNTLMITKLFTIRNCSL